MPERIITNAQIVLADDVVNGSLSIEDGEIRDVSSTPSSSPAAIDFEGDYVIPGLVELHTDNLERHVMPRPKSYWPTAAAVMNHDREVAAAGITTVFDALSVGYANGDVRSAERLKEMSDAVEALSAAGTLKADHYMHWRCEVSGGSLMSDLEPLLQNSRTAMVSVMDHTPGQRQFASLEAYYTYYQGKFGYTDAEMEAYMADRKREHELHAAPNRKHVVEQARGRKLAIASHDDATRDHVEEAIADGIVVAEFPTTIEAARASHEAGLAVLMGAPNVVRGKSHSGNVSARELAGLGLLDILSSDYVPFSLLYGATVLEKTAESITLPDAISKVTRIPANQVGLTDRGEIAPGKRADLVRYTMTSDMPSVIEVWRNGNRIA
jgi:alpha-D-ribose 1-methylphosphonate 5-triphosphate diphosphatase